jgi:hypothetical protein
MRLLCVTESDPRAEPLSQRVARLVVLRSLSLQEIQSPALHSSRPSGSARLGASIRCKGGSRRGFQESLVAAREPRPTNLAEMLDRT